MKLPTSEIQSENQRDRRSLFRRTPKMAAVRSRLRRGIGGHYERRFGLAAGTEGDVDDLSDRQTIGIADPGMVGANDLRPLSRIAEKGPGQVPERVAGPDPVAQRLGLSGLRQLPPRLGQGPAGSVEVGLGGSEPVLVGCEIQPS